MFMIVTKQIELRGFYHHALRHWHQSFLEEIPKLVAEGTIKYQEDRSYGLEKTGDALIEVLTGGNKGKKVVIVADD
jgi:NADPH-dependent curcumin reductase CurA